MLLFNVCKAQTDSSVLLDTKGRAGDIYYLDPGVLTGTSIIHSATIYPLDTILVIAQVIDTSKSFEIGYFAYDSTKKKKEDGWPIHYIDSVNIKYNNKVYWQYLYSVRKEYQAWQDIDLNYGMIQKWKHLYYLDENKKPLSKSIIVWQSMEVK